MITEWPVGPDGLPRCCEPPPEIMELEAPFLYDPTQPKPDSYVGVSTKYWPGTTITYYSPPHPNMAGVQQAMAIWSTYANINFVPASQNTADIRIGHDTSQGSYSAVGTDANFFASPTQTMNFGWDVTNDLCTTLHELGHALGLRHEHQSPNRPLVFDTAATYAYYLPWTASEVDSNILNIAVGDQVGPYDPDSIMHYPLSGSVIDQPAPYCYTGVTPDCELSAGDIQWAQLAYP